MHLYIHSTILSLKYIKLYATLLFIYPIETQSKVVDPIIGFLNYEYATLANVTPSLGTHPSFAFKDMEATWATSMPPTKCHNIRT